MSILTDVHTHTLFSTDGIDDIFTMLARARELHLAYWGISEHFDYDYYADNIPFDGAPARFTDAEKYFSTARKLQADTPDVRILVGGEFGFTRNKKVNEYYHALINRYHPDFIVNSVHTQGAYDYYDKEAFLSKDKHRAYGEYLALVRESLDADYPYDIVGHLGYAARYAPFENNRLCRTEFADQLDDILNTIIRKDKILEINTAVKGVQTPFLPFPEIVTRYFELGGRNISFGSDAHGKDRLADNRALTESILKKIGFTHLTVPYRGTKIAVKM